MNMFRNPDSAPLMRVLKEWERMAWEKPWVAIAWMKSLLVEAGESIIEELDHAPLPTEYGDWTYMVFGDRTIGTHHSLLIFGQYTHGSFTAETEVLVRLHSCCHTNEVFSAINCECRKELQLAMQMMQLQQNGVIIYLDQEGRGTGLKGKLAQLKGMFEWQQGRIQQRRDSLTGERIDTDRAYKEAGYPSEVRDFTVAAEMLKHIGVQRVRLLTNNPRKIAGLQENGVVVVPQEIHIRQDNEIIASDLRSKAENLGHAIGPEHWQFLGEPEKDQ